MSVAAVAAVAVQQVQILNKKVDLSKVTSKCGSKDNIKHKPGETVWAQTRLLKLRFAASQRPLVEV